MHSLESVNFSSVKTIRLWKTIFRINYEDIKVTINAAVEKHKILKELSRKVDSLILFSLVKN